jgi:hypothetical protein
MFLWRAIRNPLDAAGEVNLPASPPSTQTAHEAPEHAEEHHTASLSCEQFACPRTTGITPCRRVRRTPVIRVIANRPLIVGDRDRERAQARAPPALRREIDVARTRHRGEHTPNVATE